MKKIIAVAIATLSLAAAGCGGGDKVTAPDAGIVGTYTLQKLNNAGPPFVTSQDATYRAEVLSWAITLKSDHTFTWSANVTETDNGTTTTSTETSSGTYSITGSVVRLTDPSDNSYMDATVVGNEMSITIDSGIGKFTFLFYK